MTAPVWEGLLPTEGGFHKHMDVLHGRAGVDLFGELPRTMKLVSCLFFAVGLNESPVEAGHRGLQHCHKHV